MNIDSQAPRRRAVVSRQRISRARSEWPAELAPPWTLAGLAAGLPVDEGVEPHGDERRQHSDAERNEPGARLGRT